MKHTHIGSEYVSREVESIEDGYIGQELLCDDEIVAKMIFWDSDGEFAVEITGELPLVVLEKLIAETKKLVPSYKGGGA